MQDVLAAVWFQLKATLIATPIIIAASFVMAAFVSWVVSWFLEKIKCISNR